MKLPEKSNEYIKNSKIGLDYNHYLDLLTQGFTFLAYPFDATQYETIGLQLKADQKAIEQLKKLLGYVELINKQMIKAEGQINE